MREYEIQGYSPERQYRGSAVESRLRHKFAKSQKARSLALAYAFQDLRRTEECELRRGQWSCRDTPLAPSPRMRSFNEKPPETVIGSVRAEFIRSLRVSR